MLTRIATAAMAISLLGASAFALSPLEPARHAAASPLTSDATPAGMTVIEKNSAWPLRQYMSMDPCTVTTCLEA